jgi:uncharacterized protein YndB with AHSA1/START domain
MESGHLSHVMTLLLFLAANVPDDQLARNGAIQETAPVKASVEITINAAPDKVWHLLTDISKWPTWQTNITKAEIKGPVQTGTRFVWSMGSTSIHSQIALVEPYRRLAWTGTAFWLRAIHVWKLQPLPDGRTLVMEKESMDGFLISAMFSSKSLEESDKQWLEDLKRAAER